jgi:hypothetical protein
VVITPTRTKLAAMTVSVRRRSGIVGQPPVRAAPVPGKRDAQT